jgi:hypothetical protein
MKSIVASARHVLFGTACYRSHNIKSSVAKGPKFRPQNTKGAEKNCVGPEKSGAEFLPDLTKKDRKGAELF